MGDIFICLACFFIIVAVLCLVVFQLLCLADLESDYLNPYDTAYRINAVVIPESAALGALCGLFLVTGHWFMSLLCVPYLYYNWTLYSKSCHRVDITEIFNMIDWEKKQRFYKLGYLLVIFCVILFWVIMTAVESDYQLLTT